MFILATKLAARSAGIYCFRPQAYSPCRAMGTALFRQKKLTTYRKYKTAYSNVTRDEAERRLGFPFEKFERQAIPVSRMLAEATPAIDGLRKDEIKETKENVYHNIIEFLEGEGYPTESTEDFNEANVNDLVLFIILPILMAFTRMMGRDLRLRREKEIISVDSETGGYQEFVVVDMIGVGNRKFVFVLEAKKSSVGEAMRQCLLAMKDIGENNGGGVVYGFVTTGE
ncbi:hypothetical protein L873DRAFT_1794845 [Choiromyces venosus 120613-1]|uniref:Uncharacterized protein n=1 Tax=Choiromyces venosus 120613-1 TaxID=1336337 RepID=A0A3N4IZ49_9PEZI|nr:hypothetical protein L873DRAFT_1794845 [Choiromyces venosus 120613-1]